MLLSFQESCILSFGLFGVSRYVFCIDKIAIYYIVYGPEYEGKAVCVEVCSNSGGYFLFCLA